jgi:hypothetical protein
MIAVFTACDRKQNSASAIKGTPTTAVYDEFNAVNLKNANLIGGSMYEDAEFIYYANSDEDLYRYNTKSCAKEMIADLNSAFTGFINVQGDKIYFMQTEKSDAEKDQKTSAFVVNKDGSGLTKLFDDSSSLFIDDSVIYYIGAKTNSLNKYDIQTGGSEKVFDNKVDGVDIRGETIYFISSADPASGIAASIRKYDMNTKAMSVILTGERLNVAKEKDVSIKNLQFYNDALYFMVNSNILKYGIESDKIGIISTNPVMPNLQMGGLSVSSKGAFYYSLSQNDAKTDTNSYLYNANANSMNMFKSSNSTIMSVNLTQKYIVLETYDLVFKKSTIRCLNYAGQEVQTSLQ